MERHKITSNADMENYIDNILAENLTLKRKLDSKCEALGILSKELSVSNRQRDEYKLMGEQLQEKYIELKKIAMNHVEEEYNISRFPTEGGQPLRAEVESLRQKLRDALGDIKALRAKLNQKRWSSSECEGDVSVKQIDKEEELVEQLEVANRRKQQLQIDLQGVLDEKEELVTERDAYKCKVHRLNHELNTLLKGDKHSLIDLDSLIMENRFLQEHLQHAQEEHKLASQTIARYKSMLEKKKAKGVVRFGTENGSGLLLSQKQVHELLENGSSSQLPNTPATLADLRSLCVALLESLSDKTLALSHQRKANRILAARISELQLRLETLQGVHGSDMFAYPSKVLLDGYVGYDVDKDTAVSMVVETLPSKVQQEMLKQGEDMEQGNASSAEDDSLPPRLAQLVQKALEELQDECGKLTVSQSARGSCK